MVTCCLQLLFEVTNKFSSAGAVMQGPQLLQFPEEEHTEQCHILPGERKRKMNEIINVNHKHENNKIKSLIHTKYIFLFCIYSYIK